MTKEQVCAAILEETKTRTWKEATPGLQMQVIASCIDQLDEFAFRGGEVPEAAKQVKKRKPRGPNKPKTAPLTQHATGQEGE